MDARFTDDILDSFESNVTPHEAPTFTPPQSSLSTPLTPLGSSEEFLPLNTSSSTDGVETVSAPDPNIQSALDKVAQCQMSLKKIHETEIKNLHNMTKALDAIAKVLPIPHKKNKKRSRDDSIDRDSIEFKTMLAVFSRTHSQQVQEFKAKEDKLKEQLLNKTQGRSYIQSKINALYRRRDAYILSEAVTTCSKMIRNQANQLENTLASLQGKQNEILQELRAEKKQRSSAKTEETAAPTQVNPPFLMGSPSTFFRVSSPPTSSAKDSLPLLEAVFTL